MPDISIAFDGRDPPDVFLSRLDAAAAARVRRVWMACHLFQRDPVTQAALALAHAPGIDVALMAMSPYAIHPVYAAMAAATLNEHFPGRVTLCFGVGAPVDLKDAGIEAPRPLPTLREAIAVARRLHSGEPAALDGEVFRIGDRVLGTGAQGIPVMLAASGPRMLELAGADADGVLLSAGTSVEFVGWSLGRVAEGARHSGRDPRAAGLIYGAVDPDPAAAHDRLRRVLAILLRGAHHERNLAMAGSVLDQAELDVRARAADWAGAEALITDDIVARHAVSGTPAMVADRIAAYAAAGFDEIVFSGVRDPAQIHALLAAARQKEG